MVQVSLKNFNFHSLLPKESSLGFSVSDFIHIVADLAQRGNRLRIRGVTAVRQAHLEILAVKAPCARLV